MEGRHKKGDISKYVKVVNCNSPWMRAIGYIRLQLEVYP